MPVQHNFIRINQVDNGFQRPAQHLNRLIYNCPDTLISAESCIQHLIEIQAEGLLARALCHEIDHLDGIIYVDKMDHEIFDDDEEEAAPKEEK